MIGTFSVVTLVLLAIAALGALAEWIVIAIGGSNVTKRRWLTKGVTPAFLVFAVALHAVERPKPSWAVTIAAFALCFCLLGDYLLLDSKRFLPGLAAFAAGHLILIVAFVADENWDVLADDRSVLSGRILAVVVILLAAAIPGRKILGKAIKAKMGLAVVVYMVAISAMVFVAGMHTPANYGWVAFAGAVLFYLSDAVLGWRVFVAKGPRPRGDLAVMIPYHLALGLICTWNLMA